MRPFLSWLLLCIIVLQCIFLNLSQDDNEDDSDFAILDELENLESCDGGCKAPGRSDTKEPKKTKMPIPKQQRKKSPQEQQQEIQQVMAQYQHYLKYMEEEGKGEEPLSPQEFMEYMNYMKAGQEAGLSPEEIQTNMQKRWKQKQCNHPKYRRS